MTKVTLDFETRSTVDLKKTGAWKYATDESTEVLCICWIVGDQMPIVWSTRGPAFDCDETALKCLAQLAADPNVIFEAHNAAFEYAIWHNVMHLAYGFPDIPPERWRCSASVAAYKSMPRALGDLCKEDALNTDHKKDDEGKFVMYRMCKPVPEKFRHLHGEWYEGEDDWKKLIAYCKDDVRTEHGCSAKLGELPPSELELWLLDFKINQTGIKVDTELAAAAIEMRDKIKERLAINCRKICGLSPGQVGKMKDWIKSHGIELPTKKDKKTGEEKERLDAPTLKKFVADTTLPDDVRKVCQLRRDFSSTSLAKFNAAINMADEYAIVRGQFLYHGASTGRFTGKGIQFQNLPRGNFNSDFALLDMLECIDYIKAQDLDSIDEWYSHRQTLMEVMKSCIRGMVIPRDGSILRVADLSQIEARGSAWLAGQQDVLDMFIAGKDLYRFTAAQIYGMDYDDIGKKSDERFIGKTASLALGYQGGKGAFVSMALNFGVIVSEERAEKIKTDWRKRNKRIVKLWYDMEAAAVRAVQFGKTVQVNKKIIFKVEGDYLTMQLPSGRKLFYFKPQVKTKKLEASKGGTFTKPSLTYMGSDSARNIKWGRVHTYGGKLTENAVQGLCRDLLTDGMIELDKRGYKEVIHVHDELVCEGEHGSLEEMIEVMTIVPKWAEGMPLEADGFNTERYIKQ